MVPDIKAIYAMDLLGLLSVADLRGKLTALLASGEDELILQIAICDEGDVECIQRVSAEIYRREKLDSIGVKEALLIYARYISAEILSGQISPENGADLIARVAERHALSNFHELDTFIYASSEIPDRPEDISLFVSAITERASELISQMK